MIKKILAPIKIIDLSLIFIGFFLGFAICHYLGFLLKWSGQWNGIIVILTLSLGGKYFGYYFHNQSVFFSSGRNHVEKSKIEIKENRNVGYFCFLIGVTFFAISIIPSVFLIVNHFINKVNIIIFSLGIFIFCIVEFLPDQLSKWGMTEILNAFFYSNIIPALAFSLQIKSYHRLLFLLTFPLFFIFLSLFIIIGLPSVKNVSNKAGWSLLSKIGPIAILRLHNFTLLLGFLLLLSGTFFDLPWKLIWPVLITIPVGLVQIWQVNQILSGKKPNIPAVEFTASAIAIFCVYFMILALWLN